MKCSYTREQLEARCGDCNMCLCASCTEKIREEQCMFNCSLIMKNAVEQKVSAKGCSKGLSGEQVGDLCLSQDACDGCPCDTCEEGCCSDGV